MGRKEYEQFRQKYRKLKLRTEECQKDSSLFVETREVGISDFFLSSYITLVIIMQAAAFILLTLYYIKISKYEHLEGDVNYANTILNDDEVYKVFKLNDDW